MSWRLGPKLDGLALTGSRLMSADVTADTQLLTNAIRGVWRECHLRAASPRHDSDPMLDFA